jgi:hypothetical protein
MILHWLSRACRLNFDTPADYVLKKHGVVGLFAFILRVKHIDAFLPLVLPRSPS